MRPGLVLRAKGVGFEVLKRCKSSAASALSTTNANLLPFVAGASGDGSVIDHRPDVKQCKRKKKRKQEACTIATYTIPPLRRHGVYQLLELRFFPWPLLIIFKC